MIARALALAIALLALLFVAVAAAAVSVSPWLLTAVIPGRILGALSAFRPALPPAERHTHMQVGFPAIEGQESPSQHSVDTQELTAQDRSKPLDRDLDCPQLALSQSSWSPRPLPDCMGREG